MPDFPKKLTKKLEERALDNALRGLSIPNELVDFSSNDYLGFAKEYWIEERAQDILKSIDYKNGATGSRLLSGNHGLYNLLENQLTNFHACEAALVFNSGYDANLGFFSSVPLRGDLIFYDELAHASIRDGIQLSNAKSYKFKHNDLSDLKAKCQTERSRSPKESEIYIVTESVFSMDGDSPDLIALSKFCTENGHHLVVDEAHAVGMFGNGKGLYQEKEIEAAVFARIITFGKAFGCHGAAVLGSKELKQYMVNFARSFIYTTALPPHSIASIIAAYDFLISEKGSDNRRLVFNNISFFKKELKVNGLLRFFIESDSAIQCITFNGNAKTKIISEKLRINGFDAKAILSPTVPKEQERLRFCIHAFNTEEEIKKVVQILKEYT